MDLDGESEYCSNCKKNISRINFATHKVFCEKHLVLCPLCNETVNKDNLRQHFIEDHATVSCSLCDKQCEKWLLNAHAEICPKRLLSCEYCEVEYPFDALKNHLEFCGARTEKCEYCQNRVTFMKLKEHMQEDCPRRLVNCVTCNAEYPYEVLESHSKSCSFQIETCSQCGRLIQKKLLREHEESCPKRISSCSFCKIAFPVDKLQDHKVLCSYRTEQCIQCQNQVKKRLMKEHVKEFCLKRQASCSYCKSTFPFNELEDHLDSCGSRTEECKFCGEQIKTELLKTHDDTCCKNCRYSNIDFPLIQFSEHDEIYNPEGECPVCQIAIKMRDLNSHIQIHLAQTSSSQQKEKVQLSVENENSNLCQSSNLNAPEMDHTISSANRMLNKTDQNSGVADEVPILKTPEDFKRKVQQAFNLNSVTECEISTCKELEEKIMDSGCQAMSRSIRSSGLTSDVLMQSEEYKKHYGNCPKCKKSIPWVDMDLHVTVCRNNCDICAACGENVSDKDMKEHFLKKCSRRLVKGEFHINKSHSTNVEINEQKQQKDSSMMYTSCCKCESKVLMSEMDKHTCTLSPNCKFCCEDNSNERSSKCKKSQENSAQRKSQKLETNHHEDSNVKPENYCESYGVDSNIFLICNFCFEELYENSLEHHLKYNCPQNYIECSLCCEKMLMRDGDFHPSHCKVLQDGVENGLKENTEKSNNGGHNRNPELDNDHPVCYCPYCCQGFAEDQLDNHLKSCSETKHDEGGCKMLQNTSINNKESAPTGETQLDSYMTAVACPNCSVPYDVNVIGHHLQNCNSQYYKCDFCFKKVLVLEKDNHLIDCETLKKLDDEDKLKQYSSSYQGTHAKHRLSLGDSYCSRCDQKYTDSTKNHILNCPSNTTVCQTCSKEYRISEELQHLKHCKSSKRADRRGNKGAIPKHSTSDNLERCNQCHQLVLGKILPLHQKSCNYRPVNCDFCGVTLPIKYLEQHGLEVHFPEENSSKGKKNCNQRGILEKMKDTFKNFISTDIEDDLDHVQSNLPAQVYLDEPAIINHHSLHVRLPCEFCFKCYSADEIIVHSLGCEKNPDLPCNKVAVGAENPRISDTNSVFNSSNASKSPEKICGKGKQDFSITGEFPNQKIEQVSSKSPISSDAVQSVWECRSLDSKDKNLKGIQDKRNYMHNMSESAAAHNQKKKNSQGKTNNCIRLKRTHGSCDTDEDSDQSNMSDKSKSTPGSPAEENLFMNFASKLLTKKKNNDESDMDVDEDVSESDVQLRKSVYASSRAKQNEFNPSTQTQEVGSHPLEGHHEHSAFQEKGKMTSSAPLEHLLPSTKEKNSFGNEIYDPYTGKYMSFLQQSILEDRSLDYKPYSPILLGGAFNKEKQQMSEQKIEKDEAATHYSSYGKPSDAWFHISDGYSNNEHGNDAGLTSGSSIQTAREYLPSASKGNVSQPRFSLTPKDLQRKGSDKHEERASLDESLELLQEQTTKNQIDKFEQMDTKKSSVDKPFESSQSDKDLKRREKLLSEFEEDLKGSSAKGIHKVIHLVKSENRELNKSDNRPSNLRSHIYDDYVSGLDSKKFPVGAHRELESQESKDSTEEKMNDQAFYIPKGTTPTRCDSQLMGILNKSARVENKSSTHDLEKNKILVKENGAFTIEPAESRTGKELSVAKVEDMFDNLRKNLQSSRSDLESLIEHTQRVLSDEDKKILKLKFAEEVKFG